MNAATKSPAEIFNSLTHSAKVCMRNLSEYSTQTNYTVGCAVLLNEGLVVFSEEVGAYVLTRQGAFVASMCC